MIIDLNDPAELAHLIAFLVGAGCEIFKNHPMPEVRAMAEAFESLDCNGPQWTIRIVEAAARARGRCLQIAMKEVAASN